MKKFSAILLAVVMVLSLAACEKKADSTETSTSVVESTETSASTETSVSESTEASVSTEEPVAEETAAMTYSEYVAAAVDAAVTVECYVQDHQSWWDNKITVYAADKDGAYFLYNMECSEEDAAKLVPGTKILVKGFKGEWAGEVEVVDATFEFVDGDSFVAEAKDVTDLLGKDEIADYQNQLVSFKDMTVEAVNYKNNEPGDDIYVTLSKDGANYEFCLEYYLNGSNEEFYNIVGGLPQGQTVDVEGFLYWYEGLNPHITAVTVK